MKLVLKLTLVFVVATALGMSVLGWSRIERDKTHFDADMRRDHRLVGHILRASLMETWRLEGSLNARHLLDVANTTERSVSFDWVSMESIRAAATTDRGMDTVLRGEELQRFEEGALVSVFPIQRENVTRGALRLKESLVEREHYAAAAITYMAVSIAAIVALCLLSAFLTSRSLVGKPIAQLVAQARGIGRGDLSKHLDLDRSDELGVLATEMNAMCDELGNARARVASETQARIDALEQLRHAERLATVGKLAAGIAHELGTPLSIVAGHAQMIAAREVEGERIIDSAKSIDREGDRIARIVRQLLDFTRRKGPEATDCNVSDIVVRCAGLFAPVVEKAGVAIALEGTEDRFVVRGDGESMHQVFTNLIANAVHAMPSGGALRIKLRHVVLARPGGAQAAARHVRVDVEDTGSGMAPEVIAHAFEPFFTTKEAGVGTGLGLSVVDGIVRDHGGWVTIESRPGEGTRLSVYFPEVVT
jgi:two-component system, NtrC family, sensor kinase